MGRVANGGVGLSHDALDRLMPMYLHLDAEGRVLRAGPTLSRVLGAAEGARFFALFRISRPAGLHAMPDLVARAGDPLTLALRDRRSVVLRGHGLPDGKGGLLLNLSFGISVVEAVRTHALTADDFAPTDLAIEMLYLVEAKNVVLEEFRRLSLRLEGARSAAEEQALTDMLTGLRNRRGLDLALQSACRANLPFGLMHVDLDRFKQVNDSLGHAAGDHVLQQVAARLRSETRTGDTVARLGGDEFVILLPHLTSRGDLCALAGRLVRRLARPMIFDGQPCRVGASIGITVSTAHDNPDPALLLQEADQALYRAKREGRGRARLATAAQILPLR